MKIIIKTLAVLVGFQSCTLFAKDERLLSEHKKANGEKIQIYFIGVGATVNEVIQVRKSGSDKILWVSDKYNCLKSSNLIDDTSLRIILTDTGFHNYDNKFDTVLVNIK